MTRRSLFAALAAAGVIPVVAKEVPAPEPLLLAPSPIIPVREWLGGSEVKVIEPGHMAVARRQVTLEFEIDLGTHSEDTRAGIAERLSTQLTTAAQWRARIRVLQEGHVTWTALVPLLKLESSGAARDRLSMRFNNDEMWPPIRLQP